MSADDEAAPPAAPAPAVKGRGTGRAGRGGKAHKPAKTDKVKADKEKKPRRKIKTVKLSRRAKILWGVGVFLAVIIVLGLQPLTGSTRYGVCRTFIELQIPYPETLQVNAVEESGQAAVRVYYSHIDAFGSSQLNMIDCEFTVDPRRGLIVSNIMLNRQEVSREKIETFNVSVPLILQNPPDLRLPRLRSNSLADLKIDYY